MEKKNFSKEVLQLREKLETFFSVPRNRLLGAAVFAGIVLLIVFSITSNEPTTEMVSPTQPQNNNNVAVGVNKTNALEQKKTDKNYIRNPFAIPSAYHKVESPVMTNPNLQAGVGGSADNKKIEAIKPKLTGVIGGDGKLFAIIEYNGESRKCQNGEVVGPYQVTDIGYDSVSLAGPEDFILLRVGR